MEDLKDTIDSESITESKADISYQNGYVFSFGLRVAIAFFSVLGLFAIISGGAGYIIGPILIFFGIYALTSTYGTDISLSNNYVKEYTSSFGIKKGKWVSTVLLPDIALLKMGKAIGMNHIYGTDSVKLEKVIYEVFILSANHRKRILLKETMSGKEAFIIAQELSEKMDKNLVPFNPVISKATLAKRYERH